MKMFLKKESTDARRLSPSLVFRGCGVFGSKRQLQNMAKCFRRVLSSLVSSCVNANRRRDAKLRTKAPTETCVLRHETGRLDEVSEQIEVLACPQGPCTAATWRHVRCGRLPSAPTVLR